MFLLSVVCCRMCQAERFRRWRAWRMWRACAWDRRHGDALAILTHLCCNAKEIWIVRVHLIKLWRCFNVVARTYEFNFTVDSEIWCFCSIGKFLKLKIYVLSFRNTFFTFIEIYFFLNRPWGNIVVSVVFMWHAQ